jgi:hypothetical protein
MATVTAARPAPSAISDPSEEPPDSEDTLATGVAASVPEEPGATAGNRPAALPPALAEGVGNAARPDGARLDGADELA